MADLPSLEQTRDPTNDRKEAAVLTLPNRTLTDQGRAVVAAVAAGELAPGKGDALLASLGTLAKVTEANRTDAMNRGAGVVQYQRCGQGTTAQIERRVEALERTRCTDEARPLPVVLPDTATDAEMDAVAAARAERARTADSRLSHSAERSP